MLNLAGFFNLLKNFTRGLRVRRRAHDVSTQALGSQQRSAAAQGFRTKVELTQRCVSGGEVESSVLRARAARRDLHMRRRQAMRVVELQSIVPDIFPLPAQARVFARPNTAKAVQQFPLQSRLAFTRGDSRGSARMAKIRVNGRIFLILR